MHLRHKRKQVAVVRLFKKNSDQTGAGEAEVVDKPSDSVTAESTPKNPSKKLRNLRLPLIIALVLVIAAAVAIPLYVKWQNSKKVVVIGDTKIMRADIDAYTKMVEQYKSENKNAILPAQPRQMAVDDLILNAALKKEAKAAGVTVSSKDITDQLRMTSIPDESMAKRYLDSQKLTPYGKMTITRNENLVYEQKLQNKILARKDLLLMQLPYDTLYLNNVPKDQVAPLFKEAVDKLSHTFEPLLKQKVSMDTIAKAAQVNQTDKDYTDDSDSVQYEKGLVTVVSYMPGYLSNKKFWNDLPANDFRGYKMPNLAYTNDKIDSLKNVGDYTDAFTSRNGNLMIVRLEGKNNGTYDSWDAFLKHYKDTYLTGKKIAFIQGAIKALPNIAEGVVGRATSLGTQKAEASTFANCSGHQVSFVGQAFDQNNIQINSSSNRVIFQNSRPGNFICNEDGQNFGNTRNSSWICFLGCYEYLGDNCAFVQPSWARVQDPSGGYSFSWQQSTNGSGGSVDRGDGWPLWSPGTINAVGTIYINFHYSLQTGTIQGLRVGPGNAQLINTNGQISIDGGGGGNTQTGNTYSWTTSSGWHTMSAQMTINYNGRNYTLVGYTVCTNCTSHSTSYTSLGGGNSIPVFIPAGGFSDFWWHYVPPAPTCSPGSQTVNVGQTVSFSAGQGDGTFSWSASGGSPSSGSGSSFSTSYGTSGSKTVTVTSGGKSANCTVNVNQPAPVCSPSSQSRQINQLASFSASAGNGSFSWSAPGGSPASGTGSGFSTSYSTSGTKTVTVTSGGLTANCTVNVSQPAPVCTSFTANAGTVDYGSSVTLSWSVSNSPTSVNISASSGSGPGSVGASGSWSSPGITANTTYTLTASNSGGSAAPCSVTVNLTAPTCAPPGPQTQDTSYVWTFTADKGNHSYSWNVPGTMQAGYPQYPSGVNGNQVKVKWAVNSSYNVSATSNGQTSNTCQVTVTLPPSKPYLRVYGGDVAAGSGLGTPCTTVYSSPPRILGWNDGAGAGTGTQLAAFALGTIDQFSSANGRSAAPQPPGGLSFANTVNAPYGGNFDTTAGAKLGCANDYSTPSGAVSLPSTNVGSLGSGSYTTGAITLTAGSIGVDGSGKGKKIAIYATGNVVIDGGNISYGNSGSWTSLSQIPSFYLVVTGGNIYINCNVNTSCVNQLDGVFVALPSGGSGGTIYTCTNGSSLWNGNATTDANSLHRNCNSQLVINGAFIAKGVKFQRTKSDISTSSSTQSSTDTNIAEVFNYGPELWLATQAAGTSTSVTPSYDSITSLPPVL